MVTEFKEVLTKKEGYEFNTETQEFELVKKAEGTAQKDKKDDETVPF